MVPRVHKCAEEAMTMAGTDKEELLTRIQEQLAYREDSDVIHLLWKGYLVALMELGVERRRLSRSECISKGGRRRRASRDVRWVPGAV
jgi:hypothetical protein